MTEPLVFPAEQLAELNDPQWRRLGITQTFDRLLVEAAATSPGSLDDVRRSAHAALNESAIKFWEMTFAGLVKDLTRRGVLESGDILQLTPAFGERLKRIVEDMADGASHVDPTPGVTLEDVLEKARKREDAAKAARLRRPPKPAAAPKAPKVPAEPRSRKAPAEAAAPTPRRRASPEADGPAPSRAATGAAGARPGIAKAAPPPRTPANKLFTSLKVNRLLDSLDNTQLLRDQLSRRLDIAGEDLRRFLAVTDALDVTRSVDQTVELHWRGQELARTANVDRRLVLIDLVRELRARDEAPEA